eukprot:scaffold279730_cov24-Tisochrysis_lutea.AAC.3
MASSSSCNSAGIVVASVPSPCVSCQRRRGTPKGRASFGGMKAASYKLAADVEEVCVAVSREDGRLASIRAKDSAGAALDGSVPTGPVFEPSAVAPRASEL